MKKFFTRATVLLSLFAVVACSEDALVENTSVGDGTIKEISITGKDFQFDGETRSSVTISENGASFTWDEDDVIGIFPNEGDQVSFAMDNGAGTQTATFSGGGWALKSSATYAAYYPHVYENRDMTKIPVSYVGQTQNGNANTDHIGAYDFMAASVSTPSNGKVAFDMQHLGCLVQLKITVPNAGTLSSVTLTADEEVFVEKGYIDLTATAPSIISTQTASSLNVDLKDVVTTTVNEVVTVYFMMAPMDMTGKTLTVKVGDIVGTVFGRNFEAGRAYQLAPSFVEAVDLGLSVKWASCNVGAFSPEEYGGYYAWGEVGEKEDYSWDTYKHYMDTDGDGRKDTYRDLGSNISGTGCDVARVTWGGSWRMPTRDEIEELYEKCSWEWTTVNGVGGWKITGPNGNSIFLPAAGFRRNTEIFQSGIGGYYWTATHHVAEYAHHFYFNSASIWNNWYNGYRNEGRTVRPVLD